MEQTELARSIFSAPNWLAQLQECSDSDIIHLSNYACAQTVLPYWESRYQQDDSMTKLVRQLRITVLDPTPANLRSLSNAIPINRWRRKWEFSPVVEIDYCRNAPAPGEIAGNAIVYAVEELVHADDDQIPDVTAPFETAIDCVARVIVGRDSDYDDTKDYRQMALDHLKIKIVEVFDQFAA